MVSGFRRYLKFVIIILGITSIVVAIARPQFGSKLTEVKRQGIEIILALDALRKSVPQIKLIIVGGGYQEKELYEMIEQKGLKDRVRHFKNVPEEDLYKYYKVADIYISAFSFLGSSISTLEAMACSLPVITTAQPWLVRERRNGIVLRDNSSESIKDAVIELIGQKKLREQGEVSREIVQDFDWGRIAENAVGQYEQILLKGTEES